MDRLIAQRAEEILVFIESYRAEYGWAHVTELAQNKFVELETVPELANLADLLLKARSMAVIQTLLDQDRRALHAHWLSHEENLSVGHHYEMLRREACTFNHQLRGFIESHQESVSRYDLTRWLTTASGGRHAWAEAEVTGSTSEIALHAALQGLPELKEVRYGTLDEDLHGFDFLTQWQGRIVSIDAKTGYFHPLTEEKQGHEHLEIHVPRDAVEGFRITRRGLSDLRNEVRRALTWKVQPAPHWSHHYYQAQPAL
jgi:hypothetical protein